MRHTLYPLSRLSSASYYGTVIKGTVWRYPRYCRVFQYPAVDHIPYYAARRVHPSLFLPSCLAPGRVQFNRSRSIAPLSLNPTNMSTMNGASSRPQRSSSTTRSRRATLSVGPNGKQGGLPLGNGSLSPQRAMRTRVLRERSNDGGGGGQHSSSDVVGAAGKAKELAKVASKG